jgi:hypothetical protein
MEPQVPRTKITYKAERNLKVLVRALAAAVKCREEDILVTLVKWTPYSARFTLQIPKAETDGSAENESTEFQVWVEKVPLSYKVTWMPPENNSAGVRGYYFHGSPYPMLSRGWEILAGGYGGLDRVFERIESTVIERTRQVLGF